MAEIIMKVAVQDIPITALTVAPWVVRQAVDMVIIVGDSGHADFGIKWVGHSEKIQTVIY